MNPAQPPPPKSELGYVIVPSSKRLVTLYTFLKKNHRSKKIIVVFSSCTAVDYHIFLLKQVKIEPCLLFDINERQKQKQRSYTISEFRKAEHGVLLCTESVFYGFDNVLSIDWVVQYDPPSNVKEYTSNLGSHSSGKSLLFLRPEEVGFVPYLKAKVKAGVVVMEYENGDNKKGLNVQSELEKLVSKDYYLNKTAKDAYMCYVRAYDGNCMKDVFDVNKLDLQAVAASFGLSNPPKVVFGGDGSGGEGIRNKKKRRIK